MLTEEQFETWIHHRRLPKEAIELIRRIRESEPVRRVKGRVGNVAGRYPSPKMQRTIQFESQHVELWAIYGMERDQHLLEYYDQPVRIPLSYRASTGRRTTQWHTPDFFVLKTSGAGFEEWKPEQVLDKLIVSMPHRYVRDATGAVRCPPGEAYAHALGLSYQVRSTGSYHPLYIQNLKFLQDFWAHPVQISERESDCVLASLEGEPAMTVTELLKRHTDLSVDVIWALLSQGKIFTDLEATSLMQHDQVFVSLSETQAKAYSSPASRSDFSHVLPSPYLFDGRLFQAELTEGSVILRPEVGLPLSLSLAEFQHLLATSAASPTAWTQAAPMSDQVHHILARTSPKAEHAAQRRLREILAYKRGAPMTVTPRSVQRWMKACATAEAEYGCGYLGLLDRVADRGSRAPRVNAESKQLLDTFVKEHYAQPLAKQGAAVYRLYVQQCQRQGLPPVSERTFYRVLKRTTDHDLLSKRVGVKAAYAAQPFFWVLDQTTPRHGDRPFAIAHLDHTELDLLLVSSVTGKPFARPYVTMLTDAYTRRILAVYVSYDPPSYRSAMMIFRICVLRHGRLPQELVVDQGPDFRSVYFETLLSRYWITKKERPAHQPRFGSVIERLFGTATTEFLHQLAGNTQAAKNSRQMTTEVDPRTHAVWTLERFSARLSQWAYDVYDQMEHPALHMSPREAFEQGMKLAGARAHRLIAYSEDFLMLTRPTTRTGQALVHRSSGITVNQLHYWNDRMRAPSVVGSRVPIRYEPFDMGRAYAFIDGQWEECIADEFAQVHDRSEREWHLILEEWREHQRQHGKKRVTINGPLLAQFLEEIGAEQRLLLQRQRDLEERSIREALQPRLLPRSPVDLPEHESTIDPVPPRPLDLTTIPRFEVYP